MVLRAATNTSPKKPSPSKPEELRTQYHMLQTGFMLLVTQLAAVYAWHRQHYQGR